MFTHASIFVRPHSPITYYISSNLKPIVRSRIETDNLNSRPGGEL
jgi:hypothetical protein